LLEILFLPFEQHACHPTNHSDSDRCRHTPYCRLFELLPFAFLVRFNGSQVQFLGKTRTGLGSKNGLATGLFVWFGEESNKTRWREQLKIHHERSILLLDEEKKQHAN